MGAVRAALGGAVSTLSKIYTKKQPKIQLLIFFKFE